MNEFENFFNLSLDPMTIADVNGKILHANSVYTAITGWTVEELKSKSYWELIHPEDFEKVQGAIKTLTAGHPVFALEYRFLCKEGSYKTFIANVNRDKNSGYLYALSRLKEGQIIPYIIVANTAPVAVIIINTAGVIFHANRLAETMFEYEAGELAGKSIENLIPARLREKHQVNRREYQAAPTNRPMGSSLNLKGLKKNNFEFRVDISLNPLFEYGDLYIACSILDVTEKFNTAKLASNLERENQRLVRLAQRDPLTQAYNRRAMEELFPKIAEDCRENSRSISAIMLDIDHFKKFNDSYGHQTGDELLKQLASLAQKFIRENDILVRLGGEEFLIIMPFCEQTQAVEVAERLRISLPNNDLSQHTFTASFGVSTYRFDHGPLAPLEILGELLKETDEALYQAKALGRNRTQHFSDL
jgi:diguanylate cyclase (GGDEF)-like protein/PAS domain S-box-containing protein